MILRRRREPVAPAPTTPVRRMLVRPRSAEEILKRAALRTPHAVTEDSAPARDAAVKRAQAVIDGQLKLISDAYDRIDAAHAEVVQAHKIIEAQLRLVNLEHHTDGVYYAELKEQWTRQTRDIDPKKYRTKVSNDAFWGSITVSVTKAGEFLTDREINEISDVVPGKMTGYALKVEKVERVKKRKK